MSRRKGVNKDNRIRLNSDELEIINQYRGIKKRYRFSRCKTMRILSMVG
jgi:hypothetical protein